MLRIQQIKLRPGQSEEILRSKVAKICRVPEQEIKRIHIIKRSLDARKKPELFYIYMVDAEINHEEKVLKKCDPKQVSLIKPKEYVFPAITGAKAAGRPVIAGMESAGLFCGYFLAKAGYKPILVERGRDVDARQADVDAFWKTGILNPESNVQFGEGGAGTFSDGKLNTLVKDKYGRNREVLRLFVQFGAPEEILYESKPHIGTDILRNVVKNMRQEIIRLGGEVRFESQVTSIFSEENKLMGVALNNERLDTDILVLAIGHSARNTFQMLYEKNIPMEAKPFAVGVRVEHSQEMINESQYGREYPACLPAAPYKVVGKTRDGRGVYSFCMCPGGYVVNASSEAGRLCVNGMSYSMRDGKNANSAIIVAVTPEDFPEKHPLAGIAFQRELEEKAFIVGGGKVPVQTYGSFKKMVAAREIKKPAAPELANDVSDFENSISSLPYARGDASFSPAIKGEYVFADVASILPKAVREGIVDGMEQFAGSIKGFHRPDTLLSGVEARTSSPVRIVRDDDTLQSVFEGLYPCGEGAGYAGGITSAAMDGIKVAEAIAGAYRPLTNE